MEPSAAAERKMGIHRNMRIEDRIARPRTCIVCSCNLRSSNRGVFCSTDPCQKARLVIAESVYPKKVAVFRKIEKKDGLIKACIRLKKHKLFINIECPDKISMMPKFIRVLSEIAS